MDRYVVIGNPVAHSLSPAIHARFAALMQESIEYSTLPAPLDAFAATARAFFAQGGCGANVTLPFKVEAFALADHASDAARLAGAANFLMREGDRLVADNTDGAGLVADLTRNLGLALEGKRIAMLGAEVTRRRSGPSFASVARSGVSIIFGSSCRIWLVEDLFQSSRRVVVMPRVRPWASMIST